MTTAGQPPETPGGNWTRDHKFALIGHLIGAAALVATLYVIYAGDDKRDERAAGRAKEAFATYVAASDRACSRYSPSFAALGEGPWQGYEPTAYAAHLRKKNEVLTTILRDWEAIQVPSGSDMEADITESRSLMYASITQTEMAADGLEAGTGRAEVNSNIGEANRLATQGIAKARSIGFTECPAEF